MSSIEYEVLLSLRDVHHALLATIRQSAERAGMSSLQAILLTKLSMEETLNVKELAEHLHTSSSLVSNTVEQLVQLGWINRTRSDSDRRQVELKVTAAGQEAITSVFGPNTLVGRSLERMHSLPESELIALLETHRKLERIFQFKEDEIS